MPSINPSLIPTVSPGSLFATLSDFSGSLNVRWITALDPVHFEVQNRPMADIVVRQLVICKALDTIQVHLGYLNLFPFRVQPQVSAGSDVSDVPIGLIWDIHGSLPKKWQALRLAKIKRISGTNDLTTDTFTGKLRFIFTAVLSDVSPEVSIFMADYQLDSTLTLQPQRLVFVPTSEEANAIDPSESETVGGFITFKTLDQTDPQVQAFYELVAPPINTTDANSDGFYDSPAIYEVVDSIAGGTAVTDDFSITSVSHGTGILTDSAYNAIPELDSDIQTWITSFNYPFDSSANRTSTVGLIIPNGLFREFDICAPAGDQPNGDISGLTYKIWVSRIEVTGTGLDNLRFFFSAYNVTDDTPSLQPIEFAQLDLARSQIPGEIVAIVPTANTLLLTSDADFAQHFGRGHVVLSSLWNNLNGEIDDFFNSFSIIIDNPQDTDFTQSSTRISSFGVSRAPKYSPTKGENQALKGTSARFSPPVYPADDNRYVTEGDQGKGDQVDLESVTGISPHPAFERFGYSGTLCHRIFSLVTDSTQLGMDPSGDPVFYNTHVLPRIEALLGRSPIFGDMWWDGTSFRFFNGDAFQSP